MPNYIYCFGNSDNSLFYATLYLPYFILYTVDLVFKEQPLKNEAISRTIVKARSIVVINNGVAI